VINRPGRTRPHTQIGQHGKGANAPHNRPGNGPGGAGGQHTGPQMPQPPFQTPGVGGMPQFPNAPAPFLPMTAGFEQSRRSANDALTGAEGQYAMGQIMNPAQLGLQKQRLDTDMGIETDRLKEQLAGRGVFTAKNAAGTYGGTSPAGGGIGQTMFTRNVANPFGRQYQDLASQGANAYADQASGMAGAELGYNQSMFQGLLGSADEAMQNQPLSLDMSGYQVPNQANPGFSFQPQQPGRTRPRNRPNRHNRHGGR